MGYSFNQIGTNVPPERNLLILTSNLNMRDLKNVAVQLKKKNLYIIS